METFLSQANINPAETFLVSHIPEALSLKSINEHFKQFGTIMLISPPKETNEAKFLLLRALNAKTYEKISKVEKHTILNFELQIEKLENQTHSTENYSPKKLHDFQLESTEDFSNIDNTKPHDYGFDVFEVTKNHCLINHDELLAELNRDFKQVMEIEGLQKRIFVLGKDMSYSNYLMNKSNYDEIQRLGRQRSAIDIQVENAIDGVLEICFYAKMNHYPENLNFH